MDGVTPRTLDLDPPFQLAGQQPMALASDLRQHQRLPAASAGGTNVAGASLGTLSARSRSE